MNQPSIAVAICSFGMSGKLFHAPFVQVHPGFQFYACWERSKKLVNELYPNVKSYDQYVDMLADPAVDLVIVNTPNATHYEYAKKALLAGKHVIVEKPFVIDVTEGEELIELAAEKQKVLSVYHNRRNDSDFKTVKKILLNKLLGDIVEAEIHFDRYSLDLSPKKHKELKEGGTGVLLDLGSHLIDEAIQLFGKPNAVFADIRTVRKVSVIDDYFELLLYYNDKRVRLHSTYIAREPSIGYVIHGEKGSFIKPKTNGQEIDLMKGMIPGQEKWGIEEEKDWGLLHTEIEGKIIKEKVPSEKGNYMDYFEGIYQAIVKKAEVPVTAADGLLVIKIIKAAFTSSAEKKLIEIAF
ncbi:MAG: Gfo/Idh/MocA family oxidoreductase [Bacteroidota bacterium]